MFATISHEPAEHPPRWHSSGGDARLQVNTKQQGSLIRKA